MLGDLVQCKEEYTEKFTEVPNSEIEDDLCSDAYDCNHQEEIPTAPEVNLVKV